MHKMKLQAVYFNLIKNKEKIYEIRLNDEKRKLIKIGDIIEFKKEPELDESLTAVVAELIYFKTFKNMLENLPLKEIGFNGKIKEEVEKEYRKFYSKEEEQKFGIVAIKVKTV